MRLGRVSISLILLAAFFRGDRAAAQGATASVDVGGIALRYADSVNATAAALTPDFRFDSRLVSAEAAGTLSQFAAGGWSSQGTLSGSVFSPSARGLFVELASFAGGSYHQDGTRTGEAIANGRLHLSSSLSGVFAGGGGGTTWDGTGWRRLVLGELGAWTRFGSGNALLTVSPVSVDDSTRYVDGQLSLAWTLDRLDVAALGGYRGGSRLPVLAAGSRTWASVTAVAWATPVVALVAAAGSYPVDPTQGFPGGRFVSLGIRLASARRNRAPLQTSGLNGAVPGTPYGMPGAVDSFGAVRTGDGRVVVRVHAPSAKLLEITGDFNGWTPVDLDRGTDGWWTVTLPIPPGQYQMNLRIDGHTWIVPPGVLSMKDEFGGAVGLLVIE